MPQNSRQGPPLANVASEKDGFAPSGPLCALERWRRSPSGQGKSGGGGMHLAYRARVAVSCQVTPRRPGRRAPLHQLPRGPPLVHSIDVNPADDVPIGVPSAISIAPAPDMTRTIDPRP